MDDSRIVALFWARSEAALEAAAKKYGSYCYSIASHILQNHEAAEESVNDTYLGAWNSIPPHRPAVLSTYLGKLTRRISINRWKQEHAAKRGGDRVTLALEELSDCVDCSLEPQRQLEARELSERIDRFVLSLTRPERQVFVCRYWYLDTIQEICSRFGYSQSKVKTMLCRTRRKLAEMLKKEGNELEI